MPKTETAKGVKTKGEVAVQTVFNAIRRRAEKLDVKTILVASTKGATVVKVAESFKGYNAVVVTHSTGFTGPDVQELKAENRERILKAGGKILTTTHAFGGLGQAIRRKFGTYEESLALTNPTRLLQTRCAFSGRE